MNQEIVASVLTELKRVGVKEICVSSGRRNSPFIGHLAESDDFHCWWWPEERSSAFFALGRARAERAPVAVLTTSGTAVGELLPAVMEAYYSGVPLLLITADRPSRMRGTGAPQTAEQPGIFGIYTPFALDLENQLCELSAWDRKLPAHLNVCLDEPLVAELVSLPLAEELPAANSRFTQEDKEVFLRFIDSAKQPLAIVGALRVEEKEAVKEFLLRSNIPAYLEGISGLREDPELQHLRLSSVRLAEADALLRIGGVPTTRVWRDLEQWRGKLLSVSQLPYPGLSHGEIVTVPIGSFFHGMELPQFACPKQWIEEDREREKRLSEIMDSLPLSEASLVRQVSREIPQNSFLYLGNSLPIREWDLAAEYCDKKLEVAASRGLNGIDGQVSTFLGMAKQGRENWALLGDLTFLYDLAGPWILPQLTDLSFRIVVINNGGGQIFSRFHRQKEFLNSHSLRFEKIAQFWGMEERFIELVPDPDQTRQFWERQAEAMALS